MVTLEAISKKVQYFEMQLLYIYDIYLENSCNIVMCMWLVKWIYTQASSKQFPN